MNNELRKQIVSIVGLSDLKKGERYPKHYIGYQGYSVQDGKVYFEFEVESETSYRYYDVNILKDKDVM